MLSIIIYSCLLIICSSVTCLKPTSINTQIIINEECISNNLPILIKRNDDSRFNIDIFYNGNELRIVSKNGLKSDSFLRLTNKKTAEQFCIKINNNIIRLNVTKEDIGETFLLEFRNGDETRNILFKIPHDNLNESLKNQHIFNYIDITDQSELILKFQPLPSSYQVSGYKVDVYREDDIKLLTQDVRFLSHINESLTLNYYTYNEGGNYYFTITAIHEQCPRDTCLVSTTPHVHVDNKASSLVIALCGASLLLSMAICIFHLTAKKYSSSTLEPNRKILIVYQSSSKKHNAVISLFIRLFQKIPDMRVLIDVIPKANPKQAEELCKDTLLLCNEIYYIAPPIYEETQEIDFLHKDKQVTNIIFEHCSEKVPTILENNKSYKLMDEFKKFLDEENFSDFITMEEVNMTGLYKKLEEAIVETNEIVNSELLPMIVVTDGNEDSGSHHHNNLLSI